MGYTIAIAGKGGIGKSTIAALVIRILVEKKAGSVLGIDADPNSNLGEFLGLRPGKTIGDVLDEISAGREKIPAGMSKDRYIEYAVQTIVEEGEGFDVLSMGRPEGPGCYCYVNNVLRGMTQKLIRDYDFVVIDNEAGLEHFSRKTSSSVDALLVVSDATAAGLRAAARIARLTQELKIKAKKKLLLINRSNAMAPREAVEGLEYLGSMPADNDIERLSVSGEPLWKLKDSSAAYERLKKLVAVAVPT
jgi:CO dehydrogenase maturation factor